MASSNSPCAACKIQRRKCTQECVFAPYFPPDQPQKFCNVHKVFGASNVSKLLQELNASQREDAVNSLAYEADARLRDPVYGCVGLISVLQHKLRQVQTDLITAKKELATYLGPQAAAANNMMVPILSPLSPVTPAAAYHNLHPQHHPQFLTINTNNNNNNQSLSPYVQPLMAIPKAAGAAGASSSSSHSHPGNEIAAIFDAQQYAAAIAAREQELLRISLEQKLHHHQPQEDQFVRVINSSGFDAASAAAINVGGCGGGGCGGSSTTTNISPTLALGTFDDSSYHVNQPHQSEQHHHHFHPHLMREQLMLGQAPPDQPQQAQQQVQQQLQIAQLHEEDKSV